MEPLSSSSLPAAPPPQRPSEPAWGVPRELPTIDFEGFFSILNRGKWLILFMIAATTGLAVAYLRVAPKIYESHGRLEISTENVDVTKFDPFEKDDFRSIDALKTVETVLSSSGLIERMVAKHDFAKDFRGTPTSVIGQIQAGSRIELLKGTRIVQISFRHPSPDLAKRVVDAYVKEYPAFEVERKQSLALDAKEQLTKTEKTLEETLRVSRLALDEFRKQNPNFSDKQDFEPFAGSEQALTEAMKKRAELEADLKGMINGGSATIEALLRLPSIAQREEIRDLQGKISDAASAFSTMSLPGDPNARVYEGKYLPRHPKYITADGKLKGLQQRLEIAARTAYKGLERDLQAAKDTEIKMQAEVTKKRGEANAQDAEREKFRQLKSRVDDDETVLKSVRTRLREAEVASEIKVNNIKVVQAPMAAEAPVSPKKKLILAGAVVLGMIGGLGLALARQLLDQKIRSVDDVAKILPNAPCLAQLPEARIKQPQDRLVLTAQPQSAAAEAFRDLRASLSLLPLGKEPRTILFTSASAGEGKSHCAMNCAAAYALQGQQTLLIEADLRCPSMEQVFLRGQNRGLSAYLRGRAEPHEVCYSTQVKHLFFIPAGELRANPSELLASQAMTELLVRASECFDKIIIDTPPLGPVSDAMLPARHADAVCLVIKANATKRQALRQVVRHLAQINRPPLGFVLNGLAKSATASTYAHYVARQPARLMLDANVSPLTPMAADAGYPLSKVALL